MTPLLPYDGSRYQGPNGEEVVGLLGTAATWNIDQHKLQQQIAKLPDAARAFGIDPSSTDWQTRLVVALCENQFPVGFKEKARTGPAPTNITQRKAEAAFRAIHFYQVEKYLAEGRKVPQVMRSAIAVEKLLGRAMCTGIGGRDFAGYGPALKSALEECVAIKLLPEGKSSEKAKPGVALKTSFHRAKTQHALRNGLGFEAYQLKTTNALWPLDSVSKEIGPIGYVQLGRRSSGARRAIKLGDGTVAAVPVYDPVWSQVVIDRLEAGGCRCNPVIVRFLSREAQAELSQAQSASPEANAILFCRNSAEALGAKLVASLDQAGLSAVLTVNQSSALLTDERKSCLALIGAEAPDSLLRAFYPDHPEPVKPSYLGGIFGFSAQQLIGKQLATSADLQ